MDLYVGINAVGMTKSAASPVALVAELVEDVNGRYNYQNIGDSFAHWYLESRFGLSATDAQEAIAISGPNDKGIDAYIIDDEKEEIFLFQFKFSSTAKAKFGYGDATKLRSSLAHATSPTMVEKVSSSMLRGALEDIHQALASGYSLTFYLVIFGEVTKEARQEIASVQDEFSNATILLQEANSVLELLPLEKNHDEIKDSITLVGGEYMVHGDSERESIVFSVSGLELARLRRKFGDDLFDTNVRYYLGKKGPNKGMIESLRAKEGRENFWFYHNGITATCDDYEIAGDKIRFKGLQIVNGCQTVVTLADADDLFAGSTKGPTLLMRLMKAGSDRTFVRNVSQFTNTQSAVSLRDLSAHDPVQNDLARRLESQSYFYERMRGQWAKESTSAKRKYKLSSGEFKKTSPEELAKAIMAWDEQPVIAKSNRAAHFVKGTANGYYDKIFDTRNRNEFDFLIAFWIMRYCERRRQEFFAEYKKKSAQSLADQTEDEVLELRASEFRLHAEAHMASLLSMVIKKRIPRNSFKALISLFEVNSVKPIDYLFDTIDSTLLLQYRRQLRKRAAATGAEKFENIQYSKLYKQRGYWMEVRGFVLDQFEVLAVAAKDPAIVFTKMVAEEGVET